MATCGEVVWYIASRDGDGLASALVVVPLRELTIEENPRDRMRPAYTLGQRHGRRSSRTRWTPANPYGRVRPRHATCRNRASCAGDGPLQLCRRGRDGHRSRRRTGRPTSTPRAATRRSCCTPRPSSRTPTPTSLEDAVDVARRRTRRWSRRATSTCTEFGVNPQGAQMLDARSHQDGEAARMFGVPGTLVEFNAPGSSPHLPEHRRSVHPVRQDLPRARTTSSRMEQALSDLLPRSTVARFNVDGFYRPDMQAALGGVRDRVQGARRRGSSTVGARTGRPGTG